MTQIGSPQQLPFVWSTVAWLLHLSSHSTPALFLQLWVFLFIIMYVCIHPIRAWRLAWLEYLFRWSNPPHLWFVLCCVCDPSAIYLLSARMYACIMHARMHCKRMRTYGNRTRMILTLYRNITSVCRLI